MSKVIKALLLVVAGSFAIGQALAQDVGPPTPPPSPGTTLINLANPGVGPGYQQNFGSGWVAGTSAADMNSYNVSDGTCSDCLTNQAQYQVTFTTPNSISLTTLTFAFRNDPGFFGFTNVDLVAGATVGTGASDANNLLTDAGFSANDASNGITFASDSSCANPGEWCTFDQSVEGFGFAVASPAAAETNGSGLTFGDGTYFWQDGAIQNYEGLFQNVNLSSDTQYTLSFSLEDLNPNGSATDSTFGSCGSPVDYSNYSAQTTNPDTTDNCGTGVDVVVYAGYPGTPPNADNPPPSTPEPASLALLGSGLVGMGMLRRRWRR